MVKMDEQKSNDINAITAKRFSQMTGVEKVAFIGKVIVFVLTFGFAFPNVFSD